jgi:UPF0716 family protein affecting phage T7 exclusion
MPGFISAAVGLVLLVRPIRRRVEPAVVVRVSGWTLPFVDRQGFRRQPFNGSVIDVDLVDEPSPDSSRADRPEVR